MKIKNEVLKKHTPANKNVIQKKKKKQSRLQNSTCLSGVSHFLVNIITIGSK